MRKTIHYLSICSLLLITFNSSAQILYDKQNKQLGIKKIALVTLNSPLPNSFSDINNKLPKEYKNIDNFKRQINETFTNEIVKLGYDIIQIDKIKSKKIEKICEEVSTKGADALGIFLYNNTNPVAEYKKNGFMFGSKNIDYKNGIQILAAYLINQIERLKQNASQKNYNIGDKNKFLNYLYDQISFDQTSPGAQYYDYNKNSQGNYIADWIIKNCYFPIEHLYNQICEDEIRKEFERKNLPVPINGINRNPSDQIFKNYYLYYKNFEDCTFPLKIAVPIQIVQHENDIFKFNNLHTKKKLWHVDCTLKIKFDNHQAMFGLFDVKSKKLIFSAKCAPTPKIIKHRSHQVIANSYTNIKYNDIFKDFSFATKFFDVEYIIDTEKTYITNYGKSFANTFKLIPIN